jgi:D-arabinose 1-dehydrogenase-like Zn-dependent alcohol dehydrogenase
VDCRSATTARGAACYAEIFDLYRQGRLQPETATIFPLERAGEALAALRDRRLTGRAVLQLCDD